MKMGTMRRWLWWAWILVTFWQLLLWMEWIPLSKTTRPIFAVTDAAWIVLGAAFIYFHLIFQEGIAGARRVTGVILGMALLVEIVGLGTGLPFGPYIYTKNLGHRLFGVPFCVPLLWIILVCSARYTVLHFLVHARRWQIALGTGCLVVATDVGLEWIAWRIRAWRLWYFPSANTPDWPPWQNFASWFLLASILAWIAFPVARPVGRQWTPMIMLGILNFLFWVTIFGRQF